MGDNFGVLGYADDNRVDGTQSLAFLFDYPYAREVGHGFTATLTHEAAHHLGLSHPHDGFDPRTHTDYDAYDHFFFAWAGDESDTIMSYMDVSGAFGRFDKDNMARFHFAGYANWAEELLNRIAKSGADSDRTRAAVRDAEVALTNARAGFYGWHYLDAAAQARKAYRTAQIESTRLGLGTPSVPEPTSAARTQRPREHPVDPIRSPENPLR